MVFAGVATFAVGLFLTIMSFLLLTPVGIIFGFLLIPAGILLVVIGLGAGWSEAFGDPRKKPIQRAYGIYVIAKLIVDKRSEPVMDPEALDPSELRYLVQIDLKDNKGKKEFETSGEVFNQVGEGMDGDIVYQGRWLSQFTFRPKTDHQIGEDPFRSGRL